MTIAELASATTVAGVVVGCIVWVVSRVTARPQCQEHNSVCEKVDHLRETDIRLFNRLDEIVKGQHESENRLTDKMDEMKNIILQQR
uniref:Uncharacterized protein n=1 Tax=viral metagenome TaxID=1070528 RepID=A0A6M3LCN7_9ZZZZ